MHIPFPEIRVYLDLGSLGTPCGGKTEHSIPLLPHLGCCSLVQTTLPTISPTAYYPGSPLRLGEEVRAELRHRLACKVLGLYAYM